MPVRNSAFIGRSKTAVGDCHSRMPSFTRSVSRFDNIGSRKANATAPATAAAAQTIRRGPLRRRTALARLCAWLQSVSNAGAFRSTSSFRSRKNSPMEIWSRSWFNECMRFLQDCANFLFSSFIVLANRTDGNPHRASSFLKGQIVIEHQLKNLSLTLRELSECALNNRQLLGTNHCILDSLISFDVLFKRAEFHPPKERPSLFIGRGFANDRKQPGLKSRPSIEASLSLQDFQIYRLKHVLGLVTVIVATAKSPAEGLEVVLPQGIPKLQRVHAVPCDFLVR